MVPRSKEQPPTFSEFGGFGRNRLSGTGKGLLYTTIDAATKWVVLNSYRAKYISHAVCDREERREAGEK